jgi:hypothetical protein
VGTAVISQGVKKLVHKGDQLTPPTVEVRNEWCCISAPSTCLNGMDKNKFTLIAAL